MKSQYFRQITTGLTLATLLSQPLVAPAYAFWFFHHKNTNSQTSSDTNSVNEQNNGAGNSTCGRRLVPSYFINSSKATVKAKQSCITKSPIQASTAIKPIVLTKPAAFPSSTKQNPAKQNIDSAVSNTTPLSVVVAATTNIRIGIGLNLQRAKLTILDGAQLIDNASNKVIANLPAQSEWVLTAEDNGLKLQPAKDFYLAMQQLAKSFPTKTAVESVVYTTTINPNTSSVNKSDIDTSDPDDRDNSENIPGSSQINIDSLPFTTNNGGYTIRPASNQEYSQTGLLALNDRIYRGSFVIKQSISQNNASANFNIINYLSLEDYLLSVVPSEMPSRWPAEALKAQAIAARSYAMANLGKHGSQGYDLKDNTEDQAYLGVRSESPYTNESVYATAGMVLKYDGKPICAYFHSSSGGNTELAEHVWHRPVPYLKAVADFDQEAPLYNWTKNYSILQTESGLPKDIGQILSVSVLAKSPSGRATYLLINGSNSSRIISGEAARKYFSLPSSNFNVTPVETAYIFNGKGFGHGLGLSQWGAKSLATHGYNAAQILCYYYNGISIEY